MAAVTYELLHTCAQTGARRGILHTPHGDIQTPVFMPVGTQATVKAMTPADLEGVGAHMILANTYHLHLRPGEDLVREAGGLHAFMGWPHAILTDSGGFQVFSLATLRKISEEGVAFRSHIDGGRRCLSPETSMQVQMALGADVAMAFDVCSPYPCTREEAEAAMRRTHRWAERCKAVFQSDHQSLFGIVQGAFEADLRRESAQTLREMDFPGYGIGGLSVGEPKEMMYEMLAVVIPELPADKPRYLMGVGSPDCLVEGVMRGVDMFDCVLATRIARNGTVFTDQGRLVLKNAAHARAFTPIEEDCDCYACRHFTRAYLRHLFQAKEITGAHLATVHNLRYLARLMARIRKAIEQDRLADFAQAYFAGYDRSRNF